MKVWIAIVLAVWFLGCGGSSSNGATDTGSSSSSAQSSSVSSIASTVQPLLVIRINYNNIAFTNDVSLWSEKIFGNTEGDLNNFYLQNSLGRFRFAPIHETQEISDDGIVTVTLDKEHPDPGNNFGALHPDFVAALTQADPFIDYAAYDRDGNGAISSAELLIIFIVAGNEEAYGVSTLPGVFAHTYCTTGINVAYLDRVSLMGCSHKGNYAVFGERHHDNKRDATIGIIAHELGHAAFDLPDLYDTTPTAEPDSAGIGYFGLMGAGMWGTHEIFGTIEGSSPVHFCAWSKIENGWITPQEPGTDTSLHVNLHESAADTFNVFKYPIDADHYYLMENRNNSGYDQGLFAIDGLFKGGMALWYVDESILHAHWSSNTVNADPLNKGLDLVEATIPINSLKLDETPLARGHERNLFYSENKGSYSGDGFLLKNISGRGSVITFDIQKEF